MTARWDGLRRWAAACLETTLHLIQSTLIAATIVMLSTILYASGALYLIGLSSWAARDYGGSTTVGLPEVLGPPSFLWLAALVIFGVAFHRAYSNSWNRT